MEYSIDQYKQWRRSAKKKRKIYQERQIAIEKIMKKRYDMDEYYEEVHRNIMRCTGELDNGIRGMSGFYTIDRNILDHGENSAWSSTSEFDIAQSSMNREVARLNDAIYAQDQRIASCERKIKEQGGVILPWE